MMVFPWIVLALLVSVVVGQSNDTLMKDATNSAMTKSSNSLSLGKCGIRPFDKRNLFSEIFRLHKQPANTDYSDEDDSHDSDDSDDDSADVDFIGKIVGGEYATYGEFPWQANVEIVLKTVKYHQCGATILNEYWLLSAAHCFETVGIPHYLLTVGNHHRKSKDAFEQAFAVQKIITHKLYTGGQDNSYHDIALVKIQPSANGQGIKFSDYVQPACLPDSRPDITDGTRCIVSGWGKTSAYDTSSDILKKAEMPLISLQRCKQILSRYTVTKQMICAGDLQGGTGVCNGDSGGGLMLKTGGAYTILGIASWIPGTPCGKANAPGVFVYVPEYLTWISSNIQSHSDSQAESDLPSRP